MNRVVKFDNYGGPEVLHIISEDKPDTPLYGEVLVKMSAYALNRANVLFREGNYLYEAEFPSRIGAEAVGVVEKIGAGVSTVKVGDRVSLIAPQNESLSGYFADYNLVHENKLLPVADSLSDLEASTCWVPFLTLYKIFVESDYIKEESWIILPAASSSVALAANQLVHYLGAKTIGLSRSPQKYETLKSLGYDEVIITQEGDVEERIKKITGGGADFAFDSVGGENLVILINSLKKGSSLCVYGLLSGSTTELPIFPMMASEVNLSCYSVYELFTDPDCFKQAIEYFLPLFKQRILVPVHDQHVFDFSDIVDAFKYLESNVQTGKVIIKAEL